MMKFGDGQDHRIALPGAGMALGVHAQQAALEHFRRVDFLHGRAVLDAAPAQHRLHALDEEPLREGFADEIVGAHLEAEQFVDLLVLRGEEDDRHVGLLAQPPQQLHAVHARHLDVEDREVRRTGLETLQRRSAVGVGHDPIAFGFERDRNGSQNISVVVDKRNGRHGISLKIQRESRPEKSERVSRPWAGPKCDGPHDLPAPEGTLGQLWQSVQG